MIAAFIALRLKSVLGRKTGEEQRRGTSFQRTGEAANNGEAAPGEVPPAPPDATDEIIAGIEDEDLRQGIENVRQADPSFDLPNFLEGAKAAFAMILEAFAKGERETLRPLLADDVFSSFEAVIAEREANDQTMQFELVSIGSANLHDARMVGDLSRITVRFVTEQINTLRDGEGNALEGQSSAIEDITDLWTFERDTTSQDPNWLLIETRAP